MTYPAFRVDAVPYEQLTEESKVYNTHQFEPYLFVKIPEHLARVYELQSVAEIQGQSEIPFDPNNCEHNYGRIWYKFRTDALNQTSGYHVYRMTLVNPDTHMVCSLYFGYIVQIDDPDKPYVYMKRPALKPESQYSSETERLQAQVTEINSRIDTFWNNVQSKFIEITDLINRLHGIEETGDGEDMADIENKIAEATQDVKAYIAETSTELTSAIEGLTDKIDALEDALMPKLQNIEKSFATITIRFDYPEPFSGKLGVPDDIVIPYKDGDISVDIPSNIQVLAGNLKFYGWITDKAKADQCMAEHYRDNIPDKVYISDKDKVMILPQAEVTYSKKFTFKGSDYDYHENPVITFYALVMKTYSIVLNSKLSDSAWVLGVIGAQTFSNGVTPKDSGTYPVYRALYSGMKVLHARGGSSPVSLSEFYNSCATWPGAIFDHWGDVKTAGWTFAGFFFNNGEYILNADNIANDAYGLESNSELMAYWQNPLYGVTDNPLNFNPSVVSPSLSGGDDGDDEDDEEGGADEGGDDTIVDSTDSTSGDEEE